MSLSCIVQSLSWQVSSFLPFILQAYHVCLFEMADKYVFSLAYADVILLIFMHKVTNCNNELENTYTKFFKARAQVSRFSEKSVEYKFLPFSSNSCIQIEKDYATSLRRLVKNFTPKKNPKEEETTQKKEFK